MRHVCRPLEAMHNHHYAYVMERTTIMLPPEVKASATERARHLGISFAEFVRRSLESALAAVPPTGDPLLEDRAVFADRGASDWAAEHDEYLYGTGR